FVVKIAHVHVNQGSIFPNPIVSRTGRTGPSAGCPRDFERGPSRRRKGVKLAIFLPLEAIVHLKHIIILRVRGQILEWEPDDIAMFALSPSHRGQAEMIERRTGRYSQ